MPKIAFSPFFLRPNKKVLKPYFLNNYTISRVKTINFLHIYYFYPTYIHFFS